MGSRRAVQCVVGVLALACAGAADAADTSERPFPTLIALGYTAPLSSEQGPATPIIVLDHESGGHDGEGELSLQLRTSTLTAQMLHALTPRWSLGYRGGVQVVAEGDGTDIYRDGVRLEAQTFRGDSASLALLAELRPTPAWRLRAESERRRLRFAATNQSAAEFVPPGDFVQIEHRLSLRREGLLGEEDASVELTAAVGRRGDWHDWSLDPDAAQHADYRTQSLRWVQPRVWSERQRSRMALAALGGSGLDALSAYRVGGFAGRETVAGYYRNELRAERVVVLNASHELRFAEDRRLLLLLDAARGEPLTLPFDEAPPGTRTLLGAGVGFYFGIRALKGLPVIVTYGQGLRVPAGVPERERREWLLVLAGGF